MTTAATAIGAAETGPASAEPVPGEVRWEVYRVRSGYIEYLSVDLSDTTRDAARARRWSTAKDAMKAVQALAAVHPGHWQVRPVQFRFQSAATPWGFDWLPRHADDPEVRSHEIVELSGGNADDLRQRIARAIARSRHYGDEKGRRKLVFWRRVAVCCFVAYTATVVLLHLANQQSWGAR